MPVVDLDQSNLMKMLPFMKTKIEGNNESKNLN